MDQNGADFHLPDEILSVMPTDPYDQLDLARKITAMAIASRVSSLESETGRLSQMISEKDRVIYELQDKLSKLDLMFQDADAQLRGALGENVKLLKERDALAHTTKKLNRDLAKLEKFKRQLMQSLNDENSPQQAETVDIGTCDQSVSKSSLLKDEGSVGHIASNLVSSSTEMGRSLQEASRNVGRKMSLSSYVVPRITPSATPKLTSSGASPKEISAANSPKLTSGVTSPTKPCIESYTAYSPWYPSSQQSSRASSPPHGRALPGCTPRIDGKEFFRQASTRLSYEQFGAFLANIKELNTHRQSRESFWVSHPNSRIASDIETMDNTDDTSSSGGLPADCPGPSGGGGHYDDRTVAEDLNATQDPDRGIGPFTGEAEYDHATQDTHHGARPSSSRYPESRIHYGRRGRNPPRDGSQHWDGSSGYGYDGGSDSQSLAESFDSLSVGASAWGRRGPPSTLGSSLSTSLVTGAAESTTSHDSWSDWFGFGHSSAYLDPLAQAAQPAQDPYPYRQQTWHMQPHGYPWPEAYATPQIPLYVLPQLVFVQAVQPHAYGYDTYGLTPVAPVGYGYAYPQPYPQPYPYGSYPYQHGNTDADAELDPARHYMYY